MILQILAEDFTPHMSKTISLNTTNTEYNVSLAPGKSVEGVLLGVEGKPAAGVTIYLLGPMEQGYLNNKGEIHAYQVGDESQCTTDAEGKFKFAAKLGEAEVFAATKEGFARASAKELPPKIELQRYGKVRGRLVKDGKPMAEQEVDLGWERDFRAERPHVGMHGTLTDEEGRFEISMVPAGKLKVTRRDKSGLGGGWSNVEIKKFEGRAGEVVELGDLEYPESQFSRAR